MMETLIALGKLKLLRKNEEFPSTVEASYKGSGYECWKILDSEDEKNTVPEIGSPSIRAEPLIEVCSITIHPSMLDNLPYNVSGHIYVVDGEGTKTPLYMGYSEDKEVSSWGSPLLLNGPKGGVISLSGPVTVTISLLLEGEKGGKVIKNEFFVSGDLSTHTEFCYDETKSETLWGDHGYACVNYIVVPCGVIADVEVTFSKGGDDEEEEDENDGAKSRGVPDANISGRITACYGKTFGHTDSTVSCSPHKKRPLFGSPCKEHSFITLYKTVVGDVGDQVSYGVPFELSRSLVCVPAYSSLSVELNITLKDYSEARQIVFNGVNEFKTDEHETQRKYFSVGDVFVLVKVCWYTPDDLEVLLKRSQVAFGMQQEKSHQHASVSSICESVSPKYFMASCERIEILSIFVGPGGRKRLELYGTIIVEFSAGCAYIFCRDKNNPAKLSQLNKTTSLEGLTSYPSDWFNMCVKLKDVEGSVVIDNGFGMYYLDYDRPGRWFNRPLCSVLLGKFGFAAVHYIIFDKAVTAILNVSVVIKGSSVQDPLVYGTLVAQYSNYKYSTSYGSKYWRIILFELQENEACRLTEGGKIPIPRNMISVPEGSLLVVDVDLHVSVRSGSIPECSGEHLVHKVELEIGNVECKTLRGQYYDVRFSTEWKDGALLP